MSGTWQTIHLLVLVILSFKSSVVMFDCLKWWLEAPQHENKPSIGAYNFNSTYFEHYFRGSAFLVIIHLIFFLARD